jgi:hypothetical protein
MNWSDVLKAAIPITVTVLAWLLGQVSSFDTRLTKIETAVPVLLTKEGVPTDSPISAEARHKLKEQLYNEIHQLQVKIQVLEERSKK